MGKAGLCPEHDMAGKLFGACLVSSTGFGQCQEMNEGSQKVKRGLGSAMVRDLGKRDIRPEIA